MGSASRPDDLDREIERSAAPTLVSAALDRLIEQRPAVVGVLEDDRLRRPLLAVLGASRSLTRLVESDSTALEVLAALDDPVPVDATDPERLTATKRREFLRIAARDLTGVDDLDATGSALAALARSVLHGAWLLVGRDDLAVIGMGKLGGDELNYSSDIDVMFVADNPDPSVNRSASELMSIAGRCFRVDANLRPEGRNGPLVRTVESYLAYWDRWAKPWEFQALLKAAPAAGTPEVGERWAAAAADRLWSHPFSADDLRSLRELKARAEQEVRRRGLEARELKLAPGGIRDIEFTVQLLQLVHGPLDEALRTRGTLPTLAEMARAGYVAGDDAGLLADSYRYLRLVEHRVQLVDEQQVHALPADRGALDQLGRVLGLRDTRSGSSADQLEAAVRRSRLAVRGVHERVYFRPLLEAFASTDGALSPEAAVARLQAFGFTDAKRTQAAVRELTRGLNRASRLMQQMLPLLLDWLSASPDPELGLVMLRNLLSGPQRTPVLVEAFRESPEAARQLCLVVGTSRILGDVLLHNPDLVERLPDAERLRTLSREDLCESAQRAVGWRDAPDDRRAALRRWQERHWFGIAARDVLGHTEEVDPISSDLTTLAEACTATALADLEPAVPFAVVALGRFGGAELSYASDLDVVFVYEQGELTPTAAVDEADRVATGLRRWLHGSTPATRIYEVDTDLRPQGRQGPLARSLDGYVRYWADHAQVWERQAMLRARPVAGDVALGQRFLDRLAPFVWEPALTEADRREIRRLKARMERERIPAGEDPRFHLKLGKGSLSDIEWTVQLLQLDHGVRAAGTWQALAALEASGHLDPDDAEVLRDAYRFCERTRNRWYLVKSAPGDSLPTQPEPLLWLARSLRTSSVDLREDYRRVTRRARRVTERLFYASDGHLH